MSNETKLEVGTGRVLSLSRNNKADYFVSSRAASGSAVRENDPHYANITAEGGSDASSRLFTPAYKASPYKLKGTPAFFNPEHAPDGTPARNLRIKRKGEFQEDPSVERKKIKRSGSGDKDDLSTQIHVPNQRQLDVAYLLTFYNQKSFPDPDKNFFSAKSIVRGGRASSHIPGGVFAYGGFIDARLAVLDILKKVDGEWKFVGAEWAVRRVTMQRGIQAYHNLLQEAADMTYLGDYSEYGFQPFAHYDISTGKTYIVEPYIPGPDLGKHLKNNTAFSTANLYQLVGQLLGQVINISRKKCLHCDIKPDNIQVSFDESKQVKVVLRDFNVYKKEQIASYNNISGSFPYMPADIFDKRLKQDLASELWAVGAVFKETAKIMAFDSAGRSLFTRPFYYQYSKFKEIHVRNFLDTLPAGQDLALTPLLQYANWLMDSGARREQLNSAGKDALIKEAVSGFKNAVSTSGLDSEPFASVFEKLNQLESAPDQDPPPRLRQVNELEFFTQEEMDAAFKEIFDAQPGVIINRGDTWVPTEPVPPSPPVSPFKIGPLIVS